MRKRFFKNKPSGERYKIILKQKLKLRELMERAYFRMTHSKYATYADPEYLMYFKKNLQNSNAYQRLSAKNMNSPIDLATGTHCNDRNSHSNGVGNNSFIVARRTLMNEMLAENIGLLHDLGHMCYAHKGEHDTSAYLEESGICFLHHSALSELMAEVENIHKKTIEDLEHDAEMYGDKISDEKRASWEKTYIDIVDGARCHCGESSTFDFNPDRAKDAVDERREFIESFTVRGASRKNVSRTPEGLIVLISDLIEYIPKDQKDGIIKGVISANNPEYEEILMKLGIKNEELRDWAEQGGKKEKIVYYVQRIFRDAVIKGSFGKDGIKLDSEIKKLMLEYRQLNYLQVVQPSQTNSIGYIKEARHKLIKKYSDALVALEHLGGEEEVKITPMMNKMIHNIRKKQPKEVQEFYSQITREGINNFLIEEIDEVVAVKTKTRERNETIKPTVRRKRIEMEIEEAIKTGEDVLSEVYKESLKKKLLAEINQTPLESKNLFRQKMIKKYCEDNSIEDLTDEDYKNIDKFCQENQDLRLETFSECLCKLKVAIYLGQSGNARNDKLLLDEGIITPEQFAARNQIAGLVDDSLVATMRQQAEENKNGSNTEFDLDGRG